MQNWAYHQQEAELHNGDRLVLFTDGITECVNAAGVEFGEERLVSLIERNVHLPAAELRDMVLGSAREHCNNAPNDDSTLIVVAVD
jgi:serine phosphatase RsbU (regulator of sigma subunit)